MDPRFLEGKADLLQVGKVSVPITANPLLADLKDSVDEVRVSGLDERELYRQACISDVIWHDIRVVIPSRRAELARPFEHSRARG
jgi:hypothetical protein